MACPFCGGETSGKNRICDSPICRQKLRRSWNEEAIAVPEGFMASADYARRKKVTVQAVNKKCRTGAIIGAYQEPQSGRWYIPIDTKNIPSPNAARRTRRPLKTTNAEWRKIVEAAAQTEHSVNEYIIRITTGKPIKYIDFEKKR
jgi:hypothetical protein